MDNLKNKNPESDANQNASGNRLRKIRNYSWGLVLVMTVLFAGHTIWSSGSPQTAKEVGKAMIKSEFELVDHNGRTVTAADYHGKWQLVFFGFTYCPDVCPTTLTIVSSAMEELGDASEKVVPLFITVDPDRDTPAVLSEYVQAFHPSLVGLTGSAEQVKSAANSFRVYYAKAPQDDAPGGYLMGHSGIIYLMSPDGVFETSFSHERATPETIAAAIKEKL